MVTYSSYKSGSQSIYCKHIIRADGSEAYSRSARFPFVHIEKEGFEYIVPYNDDMVPIREAFDYLNYDMAERPITSRTQAATAIRILYCYLSLANVDIHSIDADTLRGLIRFIRGVGTVQEQFKMDTVRSAGTVNIYLAAYRAFFSSRGIACDPLFRRSVTRGTMSTDDAGMPARTDRYAMKSNLRAGQYENRAIPKYISPDQFSKLYKLALEKKDLRALVIMRLGYGYGLRLGEILGLTLEDVTEATIDNQITPVLFIRNRLSDKDFQFGKNLMHPTDARQYKSKDYANAHHRIIISDDMYELILNYIEAEHARMVQDRPSNYSQTVADIVSSRCELEENHYVFLNRYGKVLNDQTWGNSLKKYFEEAGIPIDRDTKEGNLSHRFRHGFAMFHAHFSEHPWTALKLQHAMRHRSIRSTLIYYSLTEEDERREKEAMQKELYDAIPELKLLPEEGGPEANE
ncbi:MAG: site-specific integrase [Lachnospiraceae bacterium]|nr:site-specific integrase [Lachnospiraceae bacterium]